LFIAKNGYVTFVDRANIYDVDGAPSFADDGTGIGYTGVNIQYGTDLLYNQVTISSPLAGSSVGNNLSSQTLYGISGQTIDTLLADSSAVAALANWWVSLYGDPEYRFEALQVSLNGLEGVDLVAVLGLELGDPIEVTFTPNGVGSPITRYAQVIGVSHEVRPDTYDMTLNLSALEAYAFLILDDASFGILDSNVLGF
jgi:hypothetical protein